MNILIVEDETMVAMLVEDMLGDLGHKTVGPAANVTSALNLVERGGIDLALLDINLGGERAYPIADRLDELDIPYALVSGYDPRGIEGYDHAVKLQKPFHIHALSEVVDRLVEKVA